MWAAGTRAVLEVAAEIRGGAIAGCQMLDFGVAFYTIERWSLDIDTGGLQNKLAIPEASHVVSTFPLAWFDETTLAIVVAGETPAAILIVDIAALASPVVRSSFTIDGFVFAGAANAEGELIFAVTASDPPILGVRFDIENGSSFVMDLPEDIEALDDIQLLDHDSTGTHLLITQFGPPSPTEAPMGYRP